MQLNLNRQSLQDALKQGDDTLLTYKIDYPCFCSDMYQLTLATLNRHYRGESLEYEEHLRTVLFQQALEQYEYDRENGFPLMTYEAIQTFCLTLQAQCVLSLYFERYEFTGGAHGNTTRRSQTWNLQGCRRLTLAELFPAGFDYHTFLFEEIFCQIQGEPDIYFEDYRKLVVSTFEEESFYCTPRGLVIYFQQYDIAPYASGIREFFIPYSDCVHSPVKTCFCNC